jgi:hypothetical protein
VVAHLFGCRPSSLFEWNDPEEWLDRLMFDLDIGMETWKIVAKQF